MSIAARRRANAYERATACLAVVVANGAVRRALPSLTELAETGIADPHQALNTLGLVRGLPRPEEDVLGAIYDILDAAVHHPSHLNPCVEYAEKLAARLAQSRETGAPYA